MSSDDDFLNEKMPNEELIQTDESLKNQRDNHHINELHHLSALRNISALRKSKKKNVEAINQESTNNNHDFLNINENHQSSAINQPPIIAPVNQPISPAVNQPVSPAVNQPISPAVNQPVSPAVNQPVSPAVNQPVSPAVNQPVSPALNQESDLLKKSAFLFTVKFFQLTPKHVEFLNDEDVRLLNKASIVLFFIYIFIFSLFYNLTYLQFGTNDDLLVVILYFTILLFNSYVFAYFLKTRFIRKINHINLEEHR